MKTKPITKAPEIPEVVRPGTVAYAGENLRRLFHEMGKLWENERVSLTQIYRASMIVERIIEELIPEREDVKNSEIKVVLGCIALDSHSLGKDLVKRFISPFFSVYDLGINVPPEQFIEVAREENVDIIAVSAVMMNAIQNIEHLRSLIDNNGWDKKPLLICGGAPFNIDRSLWKRIGADAMINSAIDAPNAFRELVKER